MFRQPRAMRGASISHAFGVAHYRNVRNFEPMKEANQLPRATHGGRNDEKSFVNSKINF